LILAMKSGGGVSVDGNLDSLLTVSALAVPPRDASAVTPTLSGSGAALSWQNFEDPYGRGLLQFASVAWLGISRVRASAHRVVNDPRRLSDPSASDVHVVLQVTGTSVLDQTGDRLTLKPGGWAVPRVDHPYTIISRERTQRLILSIGREHFTSELASSQWARRAFFATSGPSRLFFSTAICLADELPNIRNRQARALADQITALLRIALEHENNFAPAERSDPRLETAQRYIAAHLRDPQLTVERIATALGWSRRKLARVFTSHGETLMDYVYQQRLEGVRRDLLNPMLEARALGEIAHSWGFVNYTHFAERFRSHFGVTATMVRRREKAVRAP
jgi:AraC-like DNA-binding protein